jgi:hypothetical protein
LLGRDLLFKLEIQIPHQEYFCMPLIEEQVDLSVWIDGSTIKRARTTPPVQILSSSLTETIPLKAGGPKRPPAYHK